MILMGMEDFREDCTRGRERKGSLLTERDGCIKEKEGKIVKIAPRAS